VVSSGAICADGKTKSGACKSTGSRRKKSTTSDDLSDRETAAVVIGALAFVAIIAVAVCLTRRASAKDGASTVDGDEKQADAPKDDAVADVEMDDVALVHAAPDAAADANDE
jgi:hypothetical protein